MAPARRRSMTDSLTAYCPLWTVGRLVTAAARDHGVRHVAPLADLGAGQRDGRPLWTVWRTRSTAGLVDPDAMKGRGLPLRGLPAHARGVHVHPVEEVPCERTVRGSGTWGLICIVGGR